MPLGWAMGAYLLIRFWPSEMLISRGLNQLSNLPSKVSTYQLRRASLSDYSDEWVLERYALTKSFDFCLLGFF